MTTTQQLIEQRAAAWEQAKAILARADARTGLLSTEDAAAYDKAEAEVDQLGAQIERQQRADQRQRELETPRPLEVNPSGNRSEDGDERKGNASDEAYLRSFEAYVRGGISEMSGDEVRTLRTGYIAPDQQEARALGVSVSTAGGYLVPPAFRNRIIERLQFVSPMRQYAEVLDTDTGVSLPWPTADETGVEGEIIGENVAVSEQDVAFGTASLGAYIYSSKMIRVPFTLLQDGTLIDIEAYLARKLGDRVGRIQNRHFTTGTGTAQPQGIVTGASVAKQGATGQTTSVTFDDLIDVIDGIDLALQGGNLRWMMSQTARRQIRKIKDTQGRPLWEPSLAVAAADTVDRPTGPQTIVGTPGDEPDKVIPASEAQQDPSIQARVDAHQAAQEAAVAAAEATVDALLPKE
jgi:HK97 family phage major capsid protein